jgi:hypothetical protein
MLVRNLFHSVDYFAFERLLDRDVNNPVDGVWPNDVVCWVIDLD